MSCNGCRVLRKGCSESCILRPCIQWIDTPEAQGHATVFVAKFFGRADLMAFISGVPETQRPALFQSLLFEACGRTVNPVNGAVGLLWTGKWHVCEAAVETVLRGGTLRAMGPRRRESDETSEITIPYMLKLQETATYLNSNTPRSKISVEELSKFEPSDLDLSLSGKGVPVPDNRRAGSPSLNSEESVICSESGFADEEAGGETDKKLLLNLFV